MPSVISPGLTPCATRGVLNAPPTLVYGVPAVERIRAVVASFGGHPTVRWTMVDPHGRPVDLSACLDAGDVGSQGSLGSFEGSASINGVPVAGGSRLVLRLREVVDPSGSVAQFAAFAVDAPNGVVEVTLDAMAQTGVAGPGVYKAELALVGPDGVPTLVNAFDLYLEPSLFAGSCYAGPPSVMEIRLSLRDSSPVESRLIDTVMFDDAEIALAVTRPVQYFNEINPPLTQQFTTANFPSRYHWCVGAASVLFRMAEVYFVKNQLSYQAGGLAVDDFNKAADYRAAADARWLEYTTWVRATKVTLNLNAGWGSVGTPYQLASGQPGWLSW